MSDLFARLKTETADAHIELERALDLARPTLDRDAYVRLLAGFYGFVAPWETLMRSRLPALRAEFLAEREKRTLLEADLTFLTGGEIVLEALPRCAALPVVDTVAAAFGSLYVMEGSTLGGRFIAPAMAARFGLTDRRGYAYFDPYETRTGSMWNAFKACATQNVEAAHFDEVVDAARQTFVALHRWLAPPATA